MVGVTPSVDSHMDTGPVTDWLADEPPMCSVPECRQTSGDLHPQRSKAQGVPVPSQYGHRESLPLLLSGQDTGPTLGRLADKPLMCSVLWCRQTPGSLHHQRSKAQGYTIPSDPFLSRQSANMAAGLLSFRSSLGLFFYYYFFFILRLQEVLLSR